jgi:hypothetical protein
LYSLPVLQKQPVLRMMFSLSANLTNTFLTYSSRTPSENLAACWSVGGGGLHSTVKAAFVTRKRYIIVNVNFC